jgi:serine/threonine protein phosphatase PrpC
MDAAVMADSTPVVLETDMAQPRVIDVEFGTVVAFSARSPDREGDAANEDAAGVIPTPQGLVLVVADGLGGLPGGKAASGTAVATLAEEILRGCQGQQTLRESVMHGFERADDAVSGGSGQTTMVVAAIAGQSVRTYNVGDSGALIVGQRGKIKARTVAHSPVGYGVAAGLIAEEDALHHEHLHYVSNTLGGGGSMHIEVSSEYTLARHDTLLLGTDGVFDNLHLEEVVELIRKGPLAAAAIELASRCSKRMREPHDGMPSKPDDLTFILFRANAPT